MDKSQYVKILKANSILLQNNLEFKHFKSFFKKNKISFENVTTFCQLFKNFNSSYLDKRAFCYILRFFNVVYETKNFLELSFSIIAKIIASSELNIDSELEVLTAVVYWVDHDYEKRNKFAKILFSKVRLALIPEQYLERVSNKSICFSKNSDCVRLLEEAAKEKTVAHQSKCKEFPSYRSCNQDSFSFVFTGGIKINKKYKFLKNLKKVKKINSKTFKEEGGLASMTTKRFGHKTVYCKGELYTIGGYDENSSVVLTVEKYSFTANKWKIITKLPNGHRRYCVNAFMSRIYILGGSDGYSPLPVCMSYDVKSNKWNDILNMNDVRVDAASTIFEEKVIISGGFNQNTAALKTVENYDHVTDAWSFMPNMIKGRINHKLVTVKNKMFVYDNVSDDYDKCMLVEVYDSFSRKFAVFKQKPTYLDQNLYLNVSLLSFGSKIYMFGNSTVSCYDVEKDEFSREHLKTIKNLDSISCTILPQLEY